MSRVITVPTTPRLEPETFVPGAVVAIRDGLHSAFPDLPIFVCTSLQELPREQHAPQCVSYRPLFTIWVANVRLFTARSGEGLEIGGGAVEQVERGAYGGSGGRLVALDDVSDGHGARLCA